MSAVTLSFVFPWQTLIFCMSIPGFMKNCSRKHCLTVAVYFFTRNVTHTSLSSCHVLKSLLASLPDIVEDSFSLLVFGDHILAWC